MNIIKIIKIKYSSFLWVGFNKKMNDTIDDFNSFKYTGM